MKNCPPVSGGEGGFDWAEQSLDSTIFLIFQESNWNISLIIWTALAWKLLHEFFGDRYTCFLIFFLSKLHIHGNAKKISDFVEQTSNLQFRANCLRKG
jgi:hypothetical protein